MDLTAPLANSPATTWPSTSWRTSADASSIAVRNTPRRRAMRRRERGATGGDGPASSNGGTPMRRTSSSSKNELFDTADGRTTMATCVAHIERRCKQKTTTTDLILRRHKLGNVDQTRVAFGKHLSQSRQLLDRHTFEAATYEQNEIVADCQATLVEAVGFLVFQRADDDATRHKRQAEKESARAPHRAATMS